MDKLLLVNKEENYTSRDVINILCGIFKTKKIGHFGTLDPLAQGLLVVGIDSFTKLCNYNLFDTKEYIVEVLVGTSTTTYDLEGQIIKESRKTLPEEEIKKALEHFEKTYEQEVPIYSSVKVKGKKLYEYARNNEEVVLPKKKVTIEKIELIDIYMRNNRQYFKFKTLVSKGTYIRSLVNDLSKYLNMPLCMSHLRRTKQGPFSIENASTIKEIKTNNYKLYDIDDFAIVTVKDINTNKKEILNGVKQKREEDDKDLVLYKDNGKNIVLYRKENDLYNKVFFYFKD